VTIWIVIAALAVITVTVRAAGPALLGDRTFPPAATAVVDALAPALLTGLIVVDLLGTHGDDADATVLPGLAAAVVLRIFRAPDLACVLGAVVVTVVLRLAV
jgi:branched-subunit amino acid transport protein